MLVKDEKLIDRYYRALLARDASFLGVYFVGVTTTAVFCVPTCRARKPKRQNVLFYTDLETVSAAGFRACKVCQPGVAPGTPPAEVTRVLQLLETEDPMALTDAFLRTNGFSPSFLRRWFLGHHGETFQSFRRKHIMQQARKRIKAGSSITEVAYQSGYESLSGFGYAYKKIMGISPQQEKSMDNKESETGPTT